MTFTMFVIDTSDDEEDETSEYLHILVEEEFEDETGPTDFYHGGEFDEPEPWCPSEQIFFSFI